MTESKFGIVLLQVAAVCVGLSQAGWSVDASQLEFFESKVRPLLVQRCYECHSGTAKKLAAGLRLDHRSLMVSGGDSGPAIAEGPATISMQSLLLQAVRYEAFEMPPTGKLVDEEIAILQKWVADGAYWPEEPIPELHAAKAPFDLLKRRQEHWAWQACVDPAIPASSSWTKSPIDCFIQQAHESHGLKPNTRADRATLVRRVYLDLLGLPPTVAELEAHCRDSDAAWYERLIDRLLASPQFGVRFGRHWLDLVRYAESRGHEFDEDVPGATHYRDYVIRTLNEDVPYDQFVTEQIAGDLLSKPRIDEVRGWHESLIGTGFWHLGEWVHSPVDSRKDEGDRFDNMIDVLSKSLLGLTVACARCHDHKFDAISSADYYALAGFLRSSHYRMARFETEVEHRTLEGERQHLRDSVQVDLRTEAASSLQACVADPCSLEALLKEMAKARGSSASWQFAVPLPASDARLRVDFSRPVAWICDGPGFGSGPVAAGTFDFHNDPVVARWQTFSAAHFDTFWAPLKARLLSTNSQNTYSQVTSSGRTLSTPTFECTSGELSYLIRGQCQAFVVVDSMRLLAGPLHGETRREYRDEKTLPDYRWVTQALQRYQGKRLHVEFSPIDGKPCEVLQVIDGRAPELVTVEANGEALRPILVQAVRSGLVGACEKSAAHLDEYSSDEIKLRLVLGAALDAVTATSESVLTDEKQASGWPRQVDLWKAALAVLASRTHWESNVTMAMLDGTSENHPLLIRGNPDSAGPLVARRFLVALDASPIEEAGSGRRQLARQITDPKNPLTARVLVNRLWHHLLGRGIVATTDDFGVQGQRPTHPQLLDFLATRLTEQGWSIKRAVRSMLCSETYQLSSTKDARSCELDPDNAWLARARVRRLEAEAIRDTLMSVADRLDMKLEGNSVPVYLTDFLEGRGRPAKSGPADGDFRRSVYVSVRRNFLSPMMSTFDAPNPSSSMGRRNVSNVPAQSLTLLNDPFVHQLAKYWSESEMAMSGVSDEQRLERMYLTAFSRLPTTEERTAALVFLSEQSVHERTRQAAWQDLAHVLMNMKELILRF